MTIGENIKYYREAKHLTQKELANMIDVNPCTISRYELGLTTPRKKTIENIAIVLNIDENYILNDINTINYEELTNLEFAKLFSEFCRENDLSVVKKKKPKK